MASAEVEKKLDTALADLIEKRPPKGAGKGRKGGAADAPPGDSVFSRLGVKRGGKGGGKGGGKDGGKGGGKGGKGSKGSREGWRKHCVYVEDEETGETVVRLYQTDVVRIGEADISLSHGGYTNAVTQQCMNEALKPYGFEIAAAGGEWYVSDHKFRLIRLIDGAALITGAAAERSQPPPPMMVAPGMGIMMPPGMMDLAMAVGARSGPVRIVKSSQSRYRPY
jgi:hypothetical protein